jgi:hypothetical protein
MPIIRLPEAQALTSVAKVNIGVLFVVKIFSRRPSTSIMRQAAFFLVLDIIFVCGGAVTTMATGLYVGFLVLYFNTFWIVSLNARGRGRGGGGAATTIRKPPTLHRRKNPD